jgi:predicted MFS family arabinose efflux permease
LYTNQQAGEGNCFTGLSFKTHFFLDQGRRWIGYPMHVPAMERLTRGQWILLLLLAGVQFTNILDFVIMMPLAPKFHRQWNLSAQEFGFLVSTYAYAAAISGLISTWFIDKLDRKKSLVGIYLGFAVANWLCAIAPSYALMLVSRAVAGLFGGILGGVVMAIVGDVIPHQRRGLATGVIMSSFSVASILGIPLGLILAEEFSWRWPFFMLALASMVLIAAVWMALPSFRGHMVHDQPKRAPWLVTWDILSNSNHLRAYVLMAFLVMTTFCIVPFLPTYLVANVGMAEPQIKWIYLFGGLGTLATMAPIGRWADRYGKLRVYQILAVLAAIPLLLVTHLSPMPVWVILAVTTLLMIITAGRSIPAMAMITGCTTSSQRGGFMSVLGSVQQLAMGLATMGAGLFLGVAALPEQPTLTAQSAEQVDPLPPLQGFGYIGWISCAMTLSTVYLARHLRSAEGASFTHGTLQAAPEPSALDLTPDEVPVAETMMES